MPARFAHTLVGDELAYRLLRAIRQRALHRGSLRAPLAVPINDLIGQRLIATGGFEQTQIDALDEIITDPRRLLGATINLHGTFIDVGANIGVYSTRYASAFSGVIAIEPSPATYHILRANLLLARIVNAKALCCGCSDRIGTATLRVPEDGMLGWSRLTETPNWKTFDVPVEVDTVDNIVARSKIQDRISLLKIDVEGHETQVLRGAVNVLSNDGPLVLYEALDNAAGQASAEILRNAGYDRFRVFSRSRKIWSRLPIQAREVDPTTVNREALIFAFKSRT